MHRLKARTSLRVQKVLSNASFLRWLLFGLILLFPLMASANPVVVSPAEIYTPRLLKAISALAVESGIVVFLLSLRGFRPFRFFWPYLLVNTIVFIFVFTPLRFVGTPIVLAELVVVVLDALAIKQIARASGVQGNKCRDLSVWWALIVSAVGNAGSFLAGWLMSGRPYHVWHAWN